MRLMPFTAQPRMLSPFMLLELPLVAFMALALWGQSGHPFNAVSVLAAAVLSTPAIIFPLWWWSRKLTVNSTGVVYTPAFWPPVVIPYEEVSRITIESKRLMEAGQRYLNYYLRITATSGRSILVTMDNYHETDLRTVAQVIVAHAANSQISELAKGLLDGSHSFAKVRVP